MKLSEGIAQCEPWRRDERAGEDRLHLALALHLKEGTTANFSVNAPLPKRQKLEATQYEAETHVCPWHMACACGAPV